MPGSNDPADSCERAVWLAELEIAISEAQDLAWRLGINEGNEEARRLYGRLETLRGELDALRGTGWAGAAADRSALWPELCARSGG
ncbi:MAG TPA: hypothetical protein VM265_04270 [Sphingomicrobium sp.]|nr:hypothetical protein [Sphingomicrobium sp.]